MGEKANASLLSDIARVRVDGTRAYDFLQRQLSCDLRPLADYRQMLLCAWCSAKGRVLALPWVVRDQDGFDLLLPSDLADHTAQRLRGFVLREDVAIHEPQAGAVLAMLGDAAAEVEPWTRRVEGDRVLLGFPGATRRAAALGDPSALRRLENELRDRGIDTGEPGAWDLADIRAGIPRVTAATSDSFVPQMLNLDQLGALSFTKGCYPGQEIVARTQHLGRIKRRMYHAIERARSRRTAAPGDAVLVDDENGGQVVLAARATNGLQEMLIVLPEKAIGAGQQARLSQHDQPLDVRKLDYPLASPAA